ncbi:acetate kinase [Sphingomonas sp. So64.6b]|uniref:acetate/propionate family kinase n=1 Tax=Sphingomonas sp. So64.6b TaxID=2997354 RepID=UPI0015FED538|nr:acetate kinase [Sphingomonas sp. So64.6b]QNA83924.1 acetate kinase [Sphingomonas sp. So64.6b]
MKVLTLNEGSSSLKFGLYEVGFGTTEQVSAGEADPADTTLDKIADALGDVRPDAVGHRIVHGGPDLSAPVLIDAGVIARLERATAFAPLHGPASLALIAAAQARWRDRPHIACFDTGFHAGLPDIAATLPVPRALHAFGIRRYGFHGLSCQSILDQLGAGRPARLIIAHLGSGASITAVRDGRSVDTSMGLTPSGGVVMATRTGDLDPGVLLYLMRERGLDATALEALIDRQSGMRGISGISGDIRELRAAAGEDAKLAIAIFCRSAAKQIAAMMAVLGGTDMIVFTGGIGENDAEARADICRDLAWAGVPVASDPYPATVAVRVMPSQEGHRIASDARAVLCAASGKSPI